MFPMARSNRRGNLAHWLLVIYVSVAAVSVVSASAAYLSPWSTMEWRYQFCGGNCHSGTRGFVIETARSLLFIVVVGITLYYRFPRETACFLGLEPGGKQTVFLRVTWILMAVIVTSTETQRLISDTAASSLVRSVHAKWRDDVQKQKAPAVPGSQAPAKGDGSEKDSAKEKLAIAQNLLVYRLYAPYGAINYLFIGVPVVVMWVGAMLLDLPDVHKQYDELRDSLAPSTPESLPEAEAKSRWLDIQSRLVRFREYSLLKAARYIDVFSIFVLSYTYETMIGKETLTDDAMQSLSLMWILISSVILVPISCAVLYGAAVESARWSAIALRLPPGEEFTKSFGVAEFWKAVLSTSIGGYITIVCGAAKFKVLTGQ